MPETPLTIDCRAVAARMRDFPNREGDTNYLRQLIYQDSAKVAELIPVIEGATEDQDIIRGVYNAAATCGSCGELGGNTQLWPLMQSGATGLEAALDLIEGLP